MVGGLFSAALLTLVVLPAAYMLIQRYRYRDQLQPKPDESSDGEYETPLRLPVEDASGE